MRKGESSDSAKYELHKLLGDDGFLILVERFGGTRLYIPSLNRQNNQVLEECGRDIAEKLYSYAGNDHLRIPLAREFRARCYRKQGLSDAKIAVRLGITESGVNKLFQRLKKAKLDRLALMRTASSPESR